MTKEVATICVAAAGRLMTSSSRRISSKLAFLVVATSLLLSSQLVAPETARADNSSLHFQRPGSAGEQGNKKFRRPTLQPETQSQPAGKPAVAPDVARVAKSSKKRQVTPKPAASKRLPVERFPEAEMTQPTRQSKTVGPTRVVRRDHQVATAGGGRLEYDTDLTAGLRQVSHGCDTCDGYGTCEASCGIGEPSCGMVEPGCGMVEPGCGIAEPSCGCGEPSCEMFEPGCGIAEPSCGCGEVGCGSCVARPGPDYWCFPVCLPRFKDLSVFGGVQGFRGPRDFANGRSDSNFGFNEGINLSGSAPIIGLLFPQLSYQLGYRAVQSRLHGTATSTNDRSQQFVTAGFFRRVNTGVQLGLVWDLMQDDLDDDIDLHQLRYEVSLKSPQGREIGFFGTSSTNDAVSMGTLYETVDQYALFVRWAFGNGYESRLWGGATGDGEGLFGGEFYAPLSNRWAVQSGFNYLITDEADGLAGVSQESWNIGINMVWHLGKTAKRGCRSPYRPMFAVADNGWMFVDQAQ